MQPVPDDLIDEHVQLYSQHLQEMLSGKLAPSGRPHNLRSVVQAAVEAGAMWRYETIASRRGE